MEDKKNFAEFIERLHKTTDDFRENAKNKRHRLNLRTARENLYDLVDKDSFLEYGAFAVAAQKSRKSQEELLMETSGDGVITGFCKINSKIIDNESTDAIAIVYDYSVLAGTQGYFHHMKLDRICEKAKKYKLPIVIFTEGGGGRPGDTDITTSIAGLHVPTFALWGGLTGRCLRIAINNGFCFAGNAALFGCADIRIATKNSWIGMAGPAMIEGGGLGSYSPREIGPSEVNEKNGVIDLVAKDEAEATDFAKKILSYFQGDLVDWEVEDQVQLKDIMPKNRKWSYPIRNIINIISDKNTFMELKQMYGKSIVTGFIRIEGKSFGLMASDSQHLGGAIDSESADKAANFIELCNLQNLPIISLVDTPGFMVGPDSEEEGAVRRMSALFKLGSQIKIPLITIFLRKGYGLGAQALAGGSFHQPVYSAAWPTGEFGAMGLEGAIKLGFKKELDEIKDEIKREELFNKLVDQLYEKGKAIEAAAHLEIDAVIDPVETRSVILKAAR
jgi:acetyl-CoA carboxylase carboxyltransferase component